MLFCFIGNCLVAVGNMRLFLYKTICSDKFSPPGAFLLLILLFCNIIFYGDVMPKYKIADVITEIHTNFDTFKNYARDYLYTGEEPARLRLAIREDYVRQRAVKNQHLELGIIESIFLADLFNKKILKFNSVYIHSSAIVYKEKAYLFSADSGTGKSTHTKLWIEAFGNENVQIINDDKPIVRYIDGAWYAYGTPFDGGSGINLNTRARLGGIVFIERAEENSVVRLNKNEVFNRLYKNTIKFSLDSEYAGYMLNTASKLIEEIPFYLLSCNTDIQAAVICEKYLTNGREL